MISLFKHTLKVEYHTYDLNSEKRLKVVLRGRIQELTEEDIKTDLETQGYPVQKIHTEKKKCGEGHSTHLCEKPKTTPAKCANCAGEHPANYSQVHRQPEQQQNTRSRKTNKSLV